MIDWAGDAWGGAWGHAWAGSWGLSAAAPDDGAPSAGGIFSTRYPLPLRRLPREEDEALLFAVILH